MAAAKIDSPPNYIVRTEPSYFVQLFNSSEPTLLLPAPESVGDRLNEFESFERGWNFGGGIPISQGVLDSTRILSSNAASLQCEDQEVFPGLDGEVALCIYISENSEIEITVNEDLSCEILYCRNGSSIEEIFDLTVSGVLTWTQDLHQKLTQKTTFDALTLSTITVKENKPFTEWQFPHQAIPSVEYQFSDSPAQNPRVSHCVAI